MKDKSLINMNASFYEWLWSEGFEYAWHKSYSDGVDWCLINIDAKLFAYGTSDVEITSSIGGSAISLDEFKSIYSKKEKRDKSWEMTYSDYRSMFDSTEDFKKYFCRLSEEEVRDLISHEIAGTTVKACMYQNWKKLSGK